ncbi:ferredoxin reductase [Alteromonas sp. KUL156]|nr:ferredoxin reductase [Alteromonas sp. KUL154]GFD98820.1 ferredoxin reductase [Alteromonas sp. KUL156]
MDKPLGVISTLKLLLDKLADRFLHHGSWKGYWEVLMQQFKPAWRDGYFRARLVSMKNLSSDMLEVLLKPEVSWPTHVAGQHIALTIELDGKLTTRIFTIATGANTHQRTKYIRLVTKVKAHGVLTPNLHSFVPNQWVNISAPMGKFVWPTTEKPLLMIAGGSGITPFIAMLDDAIDNAQVNHRPVHLLYFAKPNEHVLLNELSAFSKRCENFTYDVLTKQKDGDIEAYLSYFASAHWLVCGPHTMFDQVERCAKMINVPVSSEHFAALPVVSNTSLTQNETFALVHNGQSFTIDNQQTLLLQLQQAEQPVTYGCGMGICHQCQCVKKRGVVRDTRTGELSDSAEQLIQLCVSQAVTDLEIQL